MTDTIIWQKPDGTIAKTTITEWGSKRMAWAKENLASEDPAVSAEAEWVRDHMGLDAESHAANIVRRHEIELERATASGVEIERPAMLDWKVIGVNIDVEATHRAKPTPVSTETK